MALPKAGRDPFEAIPGDYEIGCAAWAWPCFGAWTRIVFSRILPHARLCSPIDGS